MDEETQVDVDEGIAALTAASVFGGVLDQVATARKYPRVISVFRQELKDLVGATPEIAHTMNYRLPRGKNDDGSAKWIEGPSVRLAEAALSAWQHTRSGAMVVGADATHVISRGFCHDLQRNNFVAFEQKRRITNKNGQRFNEDMITVTGAAASKIAWRNAIFGVIPRSYVEEARLYAKGVAAKMITSVSDSRERAVEWWTKNGGTVPQLLAFFSRRQVEDLTTEDLLNLKSIRTGIEVEERITFRDLLQQIEVAPTVVHPTGLSAEAIRAAANVQGNDDAKKPDQGGPPEAGPVVATPVAAVVVEPAAGQPARRPRARKGEPLVAAPAAAPVAAAAPAVVAPAAPAQPAAERQPGEDDDDAENASLFGD